MRIAQTIFLSVFAVVSLGLLLFGPRGIEDPAPAGFAEVTYWEKWTGLEGSQMQEIVDEFNRTVGREKRIFVRYLSVSSVDQKTLVSTAAGVPPDIAGVWDGQVPQFAAMDALEPLDDLAREHGIDESYYKPVYWRACCYQGRLWALCSTPAAVALHYNKRIFEEEADKLRAAGLDPTRPPRTLQELDACAQALDKWDDKRLVRTGHLPMEPGWWVTSMCYWFGGELFDPQTQKLQLTSEPVVKAFEWIQSYSKRLGAASLSEFQSANVGFASAQNPFLAGTVVMEQQGPWMANYIEDLRPRMNRWKLTGNVEEWKKHECDLPPEQRRAAYEWGVAPFPSAVPGLENVTVAGQDVVVIPRGARHKREAFEFIAYLNRQDVMEKITSLHSKNSPLRRVSAAYIRNHRNPYIAVFDELASSPNAHGFPSIPIWPEVAEELNAAVQKVYLLKQEPQDALAEAQRRLQAKLDLFNERQAARRGP